MAVGSPASAPTPARTLVWAAPLVLLVVGSALHPSFTTSSADAVSRVGGDQLWLVAHFLILAGVATLDACLLSLPTSGVPKLIVRAGATLNLSLYACFLGVDGFASWIVVHSGPPSDVAPTVSALFGSLLAAVISWVGAAGWLVCGLGLALQARLMMRSAAPALVLSVGAVWFGVSHAPPFGVIGALLMGGSCLIEVAGSARAPSGP